MGKSIFEQMGGTYTLGEDGMYYPDLKLPTDEEPRYGKYGPYLLGKLTNHCAAVRVSPQPVGN